ncbi:hypothetical protein GHT06_001849 [Daphnia sinensis]|uniref:Uncharacterized protein n=1 Tax=Daphnia sinensis TaxID=1820382 RepID=A0AAD5PLS6_9CRUS|nr:hypothetical protein GHT06_001849 [Daphnia sinensis]
MEWIKYNSTLIGKISDKNGTYHKTVDELAAIQKSSGEYYSVLVVAEWYLDTKTKKDKAKLERIKEKLNNPRAEGNKIYNKYPLLKHVSKHSVNIDDVANYINLVDKFKLAKQAGGNPNYKAFRGHFVPPPPHYIDPATVNLAKFAELIVRECAKVVDNSIDKYEPDDLYVTGRQLVQHFELKNLLLK